MAEKRENLSKRAEENLANIQKILAQAKSTAGEITQLQQDIEKVRKQIIEDFETIRAKLTKSELVALQTSIDQAGKLARMGQTENAKIFLNDALKKLGKLN